MLITGLAIVVIFPAAYTAAEWGAHFVAKRERTNRQLLSASITNSIAE